MIWRPLRDSNTGLNLRRVEGYPNYPKGPGYLSHLPTRYKHNGLQSVEFVQEFMLPVVLGIAWQFNLNGASISRWLT